MHTANYGGRRRSTWLFEALDTPRQELYEAGRILLAQAASDAETVRLSAGPSARTLRRRDSRRNWRRLYRDTGRGQGASTAALLAMIVLLQSYLGMF